MTANLEILDGAVPLVRDEPWEWFVLFWDDVAETQPTALGPKPVLTADDNPVLTADGNPVLTAGAVVSAEIRWQGGEQAVTATVTGPGQARLSLTAAQTDAMPLGRLLKLYIALDDDTEAVVPVNVLEGMYENG